MIDYILLIFNTVLSYWWLTGVSSPSNLLLFDNVAYTMYILPERFFDKEYIKHQVVFSQDVRFIFFFLGGGGLKKLLFLFLECFCLFNWKNMRTIFIVVPIHNARPGLSHFMNWRKDQHRGNASTKCFQILVLLKIYDHFFQIFCRK